MIARVHGAIISLLTITSCFTTHTAFTNMDSRLTALQYNLSLFRETLFITIMDKVITEAEKTLNYTFDELQKDWEGSTENILIGLVINAGAPYDTFKQYLEHEDLFNNPQFKEKQQKLDSLIQKIINKRDDKILIMITDTLPNARAILRYPKSELEKHYFVDRVKLLQKVRPFLKYNEEAYKPLVDYMTQEDHDTTSERAQKRAELWSVIDAIIAKRDKK